MDKVEEELVKVVVRFREADFSYARMTYFRILEKECLDKGIGKVPRFMKRRLNDNARLANMGVSTKVQLNLVRHFISKLEALRIPYELVDTDSVVSSIYWADSRLIFTTMTVMGVLTPLLASPSSVAFAPLSQTTFLRFS